MTQNRWFPGFDEIPLHFESAALGRAVGCDSERESVYLG